ncbi:MAG: tetratricopeptide repeat protein [Candidatus Riflebacteria bacterium]|nr:tetratricopeptide repeat protein [Candidatus Riflebacteria bacterium]
MTTTAHFKYLGLKLLLALMFIAIMLPQAFAQRNICGECQAINASDTVKCKDCTTPLNKCLDCSTENPANLDYCSKCNAPLAEMRVLGSINGQTREELKLGQSDRAVVDKELLKVAYLLEKKPEQAEKLIYQRSRLLNKINFHAREAESWREFLQKFPDSKKKSTARFYLSEALRKWSYLFYQQKDIESAQTLLKEATETNSMNSEAWSWLGRIQYESGNKKEAGEAYLKALKARPGDKVAMYFLRQLRVDIPEQLRKPVEK